MMVKSMEIGSYLEFFFDFKNCFKSLVIFDWLDYR